MKYFLREICYSLANLDKSSPLANCIIAILSVAGSLTFLFTTFFYLTDGVIFWRGVHVIVLSLLLAMAILFFDAYIRENAEHKNTKD
ncbi:DUF5336 domain-containing protein [Campylobacter concisus]|uniref:DUF5336 domain-containing protein n=1 Tax=Campylobacter concisus TaxID=199 RepID=UPI000D30B6F3|nr:DUF5336 domain-containing protein [Campylobacter concisus]